LTWVEVVEAEMVVAAVLVAAADVGPAAWVAPKLPGRAATAFVPTVGTESHTSPVSLVTRCSAPSVARR
jgi:hypothetical protein